MLTKDSFPLTYLFLCYQTLENTENYLYTRFSIETNRALKKKKYHTCSYIWPPLTKLKLKIAESAAKFFC